MAALISFLAGTDFTIADLAGSGLGFYGDSGFGSSVTVGQWQGRTYITNANGTVQGQEADNCKYLNATGVILGQSGSGIGLNQIPNYLSTLNIRFTYDTPVRTQNAQLFIYDRNSFTNPASGVTTAVYEVTHPATTQTAVGSGGPSQSIISGAHAWKIFSAVSTGSMPMTASPGTSGLRPSGSSTQDTRHDFFVAISASPDQIGSRSNYGLGFQLEFL